MDHQMHYDEASEPSHEGLRTFQDQILAILPIPSAMLSVFGSSVIIYMAFSTRRQRKWSTYTRLLIGLSICDIISSLSLAIAAFMRPSQSGRAFAFGNDATCTAEGTLLQFAHSNLFYNMFLSFYFLATVRLGVKHTVIAKRYEPIMHFVALGYPFVTAIIGAVYGMYKETATGMGCWVNEYPTGCGDLPGQVKCKSGFIGWMFSGLPYLLALLSIGINNLTIWFYVRKQRKPLMERSRRTTRTASSDLSEVDVEDSSIESKSLAKELASIAKETNKHYVADGIVNDPDDIISSSSNRNKYSPSDLDCSEKETRANKDQNRRLRLVSSQAFLFVLCYAICTIWGGLMGLAESSTETEEEPQLMRNIYGLMLANAIFAPLQGFLNMLVYMRPKYVKARHQFPRETIYWAFRRAVLGDSVLPEQRRPSPHPHKNKEEGEPVAPTVSHSGGTPMVTEEPHPVVGGTPTSRPRETISNGGIDHTHHMVPLPKSTMVSDLTASLGDFDADGRDDEEEGMKKKKPQHEFVRTKGAFEASSTLPRFHFKSSLEHMRSLQAISELTESVFDPIVTLSSESESSEDESIDSVDINPLELSERRWSSSTTATNASPATASTGSSGGGSGLAGYEDSIVPLSMGLVPPRRMDSEYEILIDDNEPKKSAAAASPMGLVPPRRMDSDFEILLEDEEMKDEDDEIDYDMQDDIYEEEDLRDFYSNLHAPGAYMRPSSMGNKGSYHSVSSSVSSSCSLISFSEDELEFGDDDFDYSVRYNDEEEKTPDEKNGDDSKRSTASTSSSSVDTPIQAPQRKLSPTPQATFAVA